MDGVYSVATAKAYLIIGVTYLKKYVNLVFISSSKYFFGYPAIFKAEILRMFDVIDVLRLTIDALLS